VANHTCSLLLSTRKRLSAEELNDLTEPYQVEIRDCRGRELPHLQQDFVRR
jgi:hypothetical protein